MAPAGRLSSGGNLALPEALSTDSVGDLYVIAKQEDTEPHIDEIGPGGEWILPAKPEPQETQSEREEKSGKEEQFGQVGDYKTATAPFGVATSSACGITGTDIYASYSRYPESLLRAYGAPPDPSVCPPPRRAPSIVDQYAASVDPSSAVLRASVNAHFWPDATYYAEYGTAPCALGGCAVAGSGSRLNSKSNLSVTSGGVLLAGLQPHTTYHYRFVAQSGGGGPVRGVGGEVGKEGAEGTFTTPSLPSPFQSDCPNQVFRTGAGCPAPYPTVELTSWCRRWTSKGATSSRSATSMASVPGWTVLRRRANG